MKSTFGQVVIIVILLAGAAILWRAGAYELRIAEAERQLVTLQFADAGNTVSTPPGRIASLMPGEAQTTGTAMQLKATGDYWLGDYARVIDDKGARMILANAAFRVTREQGGPWQAVVGKLDTLVKNYAEVLRQEPDNEDAAYNYEFTARLRASLAQRKQNVAPLPDANPDLTIHGRAGGPPEESEMKKFKMIVPMRPDERLEAEKAGKGTTKVRKG